MKPSYTFFTLSKLNNKMINGWDCKSVSVSPEPDKNECSDLGYKQVVPTNGSEYYITKTIVTSLKQQILQTGSGT